MSFECHQVIQKQKRRSGTIRVTRSNRDFYNHLAPTPLQVFHFCTPRTQEKLLRLSKHPFPAPIPLHATYIPWSGVDCATNNQKSNYCLTNHIRRPKLVLGVVANKDVFLCLFGLLLKEGRRGRIRMRGSHSNTKFNTVDEQRVKSCSNALSLHRHHVFAPSLNIRSYATL